MAIAFYAEDTKLPAIKKESGRQLGKGSCRHIR